MELPAHLRTLARVNGEIRVQVDAPVTFAKVFDVLESRYPALQGTIREHGSGRRRAFLRFFAEQEDLSFWQMDAELPRAVVEGREALLVIGAVAGGSQ